MTDAVKWVDAGWGTTALSVPSVVWVAEKLNSHNLQEFADKHGMNGRTFSVAVSPWYPETWLIPSILTTYCCEHAGEVTAPNCPKCGAEVISWQ